MCTFSSSSSIEFSVLVEIEIVHFAIGKSETELAKDRRQLLEGRETNRVVGVVILVIVVVFF